MKTEDIYMELFGFSRPTYYKWKREKVKVIQLLEKYFTSEDLEEFLETGSIRRFEADKYKSFADPILLDHAYYSLKLKLKELFGGTMLGPNKLYTKGAKDILIDVLKKISPKDTSFTIENAKERLLDRISEEELKWLALKNPAKRELLSHYIKENFSNAEILAMVQKKDDVVEFLKKI